MKERIVGIAVVLMVAGLVALASREVGEPMAARHRLAAYRTSLAGRSAAQRRNAALAASRIDGAVLLPGHVFSFNKRVGRWTRDRGYETAPVSFEGWFTTAAGGGVCQVATTLYNAVLLAGLPVLERHQHSVCPRYVRPGRDAAVAQTTLDLRFRNSTPGPIVIRASADEWAVSVDIYGCVVLEQEVALVTEYLSVTRPQVLVRDRDHLALLAGRSGATAVRGMPGYHVVTYRCYLKDGQEIRRERLSEDRYQPVHPVFRASSAQGP